MSDMHKCNSSRSRYYKGRVNPSSAKKPLPRESIATTVKGPAPPTDEHRQSESYQAPTRSDHFKEVAMQTKSTVKDIKMHQ